MNRAFEGLSETQTQTQTPQPNSQERGERRGEETNDNTVARDQVNIAPDRFYIAIELK